MTKIKVFERLTASENHKGWDVWSKIKRREKERTGQRHAFVSGPDPQDRFCAACNAYLTDNVHFRVGEEDRGSR